MNPRERRAAREFRAYVEQLFGPQLDLLVAVECPPGYAGSQVFLVADGIPTGSLTDGGSLDRADVVRVALRLVAIRSERYTLPDGLVPVTGEDARGDLQEDFTRLFKEGVEVDWPWCDLLRAGGELLYVDGVMSVRTRQAKSDFCSAPVVRRPAVRRPCVRRDDHQSHRAPQPRGVRTLRSPGLAPGGPVAPRALRHLPSGAGIAMADVYRCLTRRAWSVRESGRVVRHAQAIALRDVTFRTSEATRVRLLRTGQREVHAWARGTQLDAGRPDGAVRIRYRPMLCHGFTTADGRVVVSAEVAWFEIHGTAWMTGGVYADLGSE